MRGVVAAGLLTLCIGSAIAATEPEAITLASPPLAYAKAALGGQRGTVAVGVWRDGKARFAGLRDGAELPAADVGGPDAPLFEIGSISKVFTGLLLAQAVERGELGLDDTLGKRLGDIAVGERPAGIAFVDPKVAAITLRQLVTHTACLPRLPGDFATGADPPDPYRGYDRARLWQALAAQRLEHAAPCEARYSNFGVALLGQLLAARAGQPWEALVRAQITAPLGMVDTRVDPGDKAARVAPAFAGSAPAGPWTLGAFVGAGGLRSTAADMLTFGRAILAGRDGPLGPAAERLVTPLARFGDASIGYAIQVRGPPDRRSYSHDGATGGYRAELLLAADTGEVMVVLASNAAAPVGRLAAELAAARYPVALAPAGTKADCLDDCAGVYRLDPRTALTFVVQDGVMHVHATGRPFDALAPGGDAAFTFGSVARFAFERDAAGRALAVTMTSRGEARRAARIEAPLPARARTPGAEAYAGRYALAPSQAFDVQAQAGQLSVQLGTQPRFSVYPVEGSPDRFAYDVVEAAPQFERDAAGKVVGVVLHQNGTHRAPRAE